MCLDIVLSQSQLSLGVIEGPPVHPVGVLVALTAWGRRINAVNLTAILLCQLHKDNWSFRYNSVDDKC